MICGRPTSAGEPLEVAAGGTHVSEGVAGGAEWAVDLLVVVVADSVAGADLIDGVLALEVALAVLCVREHVVRIVTRCHVGAEGWLAGGEGEERGCGCAEEGDGCGLHVVSMMICSDECGWLENGARMAAGSPHGAGAGDGLGRISNVVGTGAGGAAALTVTVAEVLVLNLRKAAGGGVPLLIGGRRRIVGGDAGTEESSGQDGTQDEGIHPWKTGGCGLDDGGECSRFHGSNDDQEDLMISGRVKVKAAGRGGS